MNVIRAVIAVVEVFFTRALKADSDVIVHADEVLILRRLTT